jgi:arylamine N-acetyltransferase
VPKFHPATSIFLDLYRITPSRADLDLLNLLARRFSALPWENLTKFLKKHASRGSAPADPAPPGPLRGSEEVLRDHAALGTGGTCFSLTNALRRIVTDLGFEAFPAMADMQHGPNVHCGLIVLVDGRRHLLDPGYLVPDPVPLDGPPAVSIENPGHRLDYRTAPDGGTVELCTVNARGERKRRYRLRARPVPEPDFRRHWIDSFEAPGMRGLQLNRFGDGARLSAHGYNLRIDTGRGKKNVKLREDYAGLIAAHFGIDAALAGAALEQWKRIRWPNDGTPSRS